MKITSVVSQFSLEIQSLSGVKSQMTVTLEATPDEHETWDMDKARHAHITLAENAVKEVFTALAAEGAIDAKEAKAQLGKMTERFKAIRSKREQALGEILAAATKNKEEVIDAY